MGTCFLLFSLSLLLLILRAVQRGLAEWGADIDRRILGMMGLENTGKKRIIWQGEVSWCFQVVVIEKGRSKKSTGQ